MKRFKMQFIAAFLHQF